MKKILSAVILTESGELWEIGNDQLLMTGVDDIFYSGDFLYRSGGRTFSLTTGLENDLIFTGYRDEFVFFVTEKSISSMTSMGNMNYQIPE